MIDHPSAWASTFRVGYTIEEDSDVFIRMPLFTEEYSGIPNQTCFYPCTFCENEISVSLMAGGYIASRRDVEISSCFSWSDETIYVMALYSPTMFRPSRALPEAPFQVERHPRRAITSIPEQATSFRCWGSVCRRLQHETGHLKCTCTLFSYLTN